MRFNDAAATTFEKIARMPGMGERWDSSKPRLAGMRVWRVEGFEKHLIFYQSSDEGVAIVLVLHGARDMETVLEEDIPN